MVVVEVISSAMRRPPTPPAPCNDPLRSLPQVNVRVREKVLRLKVEVASVLVRSSMTFQPS